MDFSKFHLFWEKKGLSAKEVPIVCSDLRASAASKAAKTARLTERTLQDDSI